MFEVLAQFVKLGGTLTQPADIDFEEAKRLVQNILVDNVYVLRADQLRVGIA